MRGQFDEQFGHVHPPGGPGSAGKPEEYPLAAFGEHSFYEGRLNMAIQGNEPGEKSAKDLKREYWAFISYRHLDNQQDGRRWADWLHQQLEGYEVPDVLKGKENERGDVIPDRLYPVFRDETDLPAGADLSTGIRQALDRSKYLIVICSPRSVESQYVNDEILYFKKTGKGNRILAVMIEGEPNVSWDVGKQKAGFSPYRECLPPALVHPVDMDGNLDKARHEEPVAADFRLPEGKGDLQGWTSSAAYRENLILQNTHKPQVIKELVGRYDQTLKEGLARIMAGALGVPVRDYEANDKEYRLRKERQKSRNLARWLAVTAVLALVAAGSGIFAWQKAVEATAQRDRADEQAQLAKTNETEAVAQKELAERQKVEAEKQSQIAGQSMNLLTGIFFTIDPAETQQREVTVREVMDRLGEELETSEFDPEVELSLRRTLAVIYEKLGRPHDAEMHGARMLTLAEQLYEGIDNKQLADALNTYGIFLESVGRSSAAVLKYEDSLAMLQKIYNGDHPDMADILDNMANSLQSLGSLAAALSGHEKALEMTMRIYEGDHPSVALRLNNLASCLQSLGQSTEALPNFEFSLEMYQRIYVKDHPDVARGLNNVANCLDDLGRFGEALPKHDEALSMYQRIYAGDHPNVALGLNNVAYCLQSLGRLAEALPKYEESLAMKQRIHKGDHPDVALGLNNVAFCLDSLGRSAEALPNFQESLVMYQRIYGGDHPDVALKLNNVAACLHSLGRSDQALPKYEEAMAMYQRIYKGDHPDVALGLNNVAACLNSLDRSDEALPKYEEALAMYQRIYSGDHSAVALGIGNIGFCLQSLDRLDEALPKYEESLVMYQRIYKGDHPDVAFEINNIAVCLDSLGRSDEALPKYKESLAMRQRIYKGDHPDVVSSLNNLAICLQHLDLVDQAYGYFVQEANMRSRLERKENPDRWFFTVYITNVLDHSTAQKAGIQAGDEVVSYHDYRCLDIAQLQGLEKHFANESKVPMEILRDGKLIALEVDPGILGVELDYYWLTREQADEAYEKYGDTIPEPILSNANNEGLDE